MTKKCIKYQTHLLLPQITLPAVYVIARSRFHLKHWSRYFCPAAAKIARPAYCGVRFGRCRVFRGPQESPAHASTTGLMEYSLHLWHDLPGIPTLPVHQSVLALRPEMRAVSRPLLREWKGHCSCSGTIAETCFTFSLSLLKLLVASFPCQFGSSSPLRGVLTGERLTGRSLDDIFDIILLHSYKVNIC